MVTACASGPDVTFVDKHSSSSYRFIYEPAVGDPISYEGTTDQSYDQPIECCFTVDRWTDTTLDFFAGNHIVDFPVSGDCPAVAEAHVQIDTPGPGLYELTADTARMNIFYKQPDPEHCQHQLGSNEVDPSSRGIELSGQVKLDELQCLNPPDGIACALVASGTFAMEGTIDKTLVFQLSGSLESGDTVVSD
jgi:hypothetical protein